MATWTLYSSVLLSLKADTWQKWLKGGRIYFSSQFQKLQFILVDLIDSGPMVSQSFTTARASGRGQLFTLWWTGSRRDKEPGRTFKDMSPITNLLPPTRPHLPKVSRTSQNSTTSWRPIHNRPQEHKKRSCSGTHMTSLPSHPIGQSK
jgi:hypothetical protein